jgi:hemolysin activation/secretion protein
MRRLAFVFLFLLAGAAAAQVQIPPSADPGVQQQREMEREKRLLDEELRRDRIEQPLKPLAPKPAPAAPAGEELQVFVREILFEPPSEILKAEELDALAAPYRGRALRFAELRELVAKVNELYKSKGVVTAQASLPRQDVTAGVVHIRLVEGRVGKLRIEGNASTDTDYITDRLRLKPSMLVDLTGLEEDMVRFNRTNDAQMRADLAPGAAFGQTDVDVTIVEPKRDDFRVTMDNAGSAGTGELQTGVSYLRRSFTGRRDDLYLASSTAEGHRGMYLTYGLPVNTLGTRLTLGYFNDKTAIVHGFIAPLNVTGEATAYSATLRHPLIVERGFELDGLLSVKKRHTVNWIDTSLLSASDLNGRTIGLDLQVPGAAGYWTANAEYGWGRDAPLGADERPYNVARGNVRRSLSLNTDTTAVGSLIWQYAPVTLLPASEQLIIGGEGTVRGYSTGLFSGDRGFVLNLELQRNVPLPRDWSWKATAFAFLDRGEVRPFRPPGNQQSTDVATSGGGGFNFFWGKELSGRIALEIPISKRPEEPRDYRIGFQFVWHVL